MVRFTTCIGLLACALLGVAGCGTGDARIERDARAACDALQPGTTTIRQADALLSSSQFFAGPSCETDLLPFKDVAADACGEPASVCTMRWSWLSNADCSPMGGCTYVCEARVRDPGTGSVAPDAVICARRFLTGQNPY